jgi:hypothetical protein
MRKKGETGVQDRIKPQPMQKKVREEKRKKKKLDRAERQSALMLHEQREKGEKKS